MSNSLKLYNELNVKFDVFLGVTLKILGTNSSTLQSSTVFSTDDDVEFLAEVVPASGSHIFFWYWGPNVENSRRTLSSKMKQRFRNYGR